MSDFLAFYSEFFIAPFTTIKDVYANRAIFTHFIGLNITKMDLCVDYKYNKNVNKRLPKSMGGTHSSVVQLTPSQRQNRKDARTIGKFDVKLTRKIFNMLCTAEKKNLFFLLGLEKEKKIHTLDSGINVPP